MPEMGQPRPSSANASPPPRATARRASPSPISSAPRAPIGAPQRRHAQPTDQNALTATGTIRVLDAMLLVKDDAMVPGSAVVALAIEHLWAVGLVNAVSEAGVELAFQYRVPAIVIDEAYASRATNA